jgi:hypothetical protein
LFAFTSFATGARVAAQGPATLDELNRRVTVLEAASTSASLAAWFAFGVVGVAFAIAWAYVSHLREATRRQEIEGTESKRIAAAAAQQVNAIVELARQFETDARASKTAGDTAVRVHDLLQRLSEKIGKGSWAQK